MKHISKTFIVILSLLIFTKVSTFGQCAAPSNVTVTTTSTTATVNFTANGATKHVIRYRASGSNVVIKQSTFGGTQFNLTELSPCTTYNFSIRANCVPAVGTGKMTFTTTGCRIGNEQENSQALSVFPNPSADNITVSFYSAQDEVVEISIFDLTGRLVQQQREEATSGSNQISYNIESLSDGTYIVQVKNSNGIFTSKFIAE
ncbi:MAG TPA: T9SS type A sorting domain-containing protein [Chitinophagales bacterium]|nr:T9SS type A sorting domain-containing protein [Chitinophagales bacterium]